MLDPRNSRTLFWIGLAFVAFLFIPAQARAEGREKEKTYKVKAVGTAPEASIGGLFSDAGALGKYAVSGAGLLFNPTDFSDQGFIKTWLLLGPYTQPAGLTAAPGLANIRKDHLTDEGANQELTVQPKAGDTVQTHYGPPTCAPVGTPGCKAPPKARSIGLTAPATPNGINPGGIPTWAE